VCRVLSIGEHKAKTWLSGIVTDAQEVVPGEIWCITAQTAGQPKEQFYVLEATCEVIGHPPPPPQATPSVTNLGNATNLRRDWSEWIAHRSAPSTELTPKAPLFAMMRWAHAEEYHLGIAKAWLDRLLKEGEVGAFKRAIAERYVLASVVGNRYVLWYLSDIHSSLAGRCLRIVSVDAGGPSTKWLRSLLV
jgi:hypothetical protein